MFVKKNTLFKKDYHYHPTLNEENSILPDHLKNITQPSGSILSDVIVPIGYYSDVEEILTQLIGRLIETHQIFIQ